MSCKHEVVKEYDVTYGHLVIHRKCIYTDKKDTLNYKQIDYYKSGKLLSKTIYINGKANGEYVQFDPLGRIMIKENLSNNKVDGLRQEFDSLGMVALEIYYINGTRVLYSDVGYSKDGIRKKQDYYVITNDTAFKIGTLIKQGDTILNDLSRYAVIEGDDTINTLNYCLKLKICKKQVPEAKFEITFGKPDLKLRFTGIDTTFFTTNKENSICVLKLKTGINHIFCRIILHEGSKMLDSYYVYKDVYVESNALSKVKL